MANIVKRNGKNGAEQPEVVEGQIVRVDAELVKAELETQGALALTRPRDEHAIDKKIRNLMENYPAFAERAYYSYPRGGKQVIGISVVLARELARLWGNCTYGARIVSDTEDSFAVEGIFIDHENNTRSVWPMSAKKLVRRRNEYGDSVWRRPDARELVELMGMVCAKAQRNAILNALPQFFKEQWLETAKRVVAERMKQNMPKRIEQLQEWFSSKYNVTTKQLEEYIGKPVSDFTADDLATLRGVAQGLSDGEYTIDQIFGQKEVETRVPNAPSADKLFNGNMAETVKEQNSASEQENSNHNANKVEPAQGNKVKMDYAKAQFKKIFIETWNQQNNEKPDFRFKAHKDAANKLWHTICKDLFGTYQPENAEQVLEMAKEIPNYVVAEGVRIPSDDELDQAVSKMEEAEGEVMF